MLTQQVIEALTEAAAAATRTDRNRAPAYARHLLGTLAEDCEPLFAELTRRHEELDRWRSLAACDPLTLVANRRTFEAELEREIARHRRTRAPFAVILLDLDDPKLRNDSYDHAAGDEARIALTRVCQQTLRETDLFARIGGDEFAALLPSSTHEGALALSARLREAIELVHVQTALRVSMGCGSSEAAEPSPTAIMAEADQDLYRDKARRKHAARECAA